MTDSGSLDSEGHAANTLYVPIPYAPCTGHYLWCGHSEVINTPVPSLPSQPSTTCHSSHQPSTTLHPIDHIPSHQPRPITFHPVPSPSLRPQAQTSHSRPASFCEQHAMTASTTVRHQRHQPHPPSIQPRLEALAPWTSFSLDNGDARRETFFVATAIHLSMTSDRCLTPWKRPTCARVLPTRSDCCSRDPRTSPRCRYHLTVDIIGNAVLSTNTMVPIAPRTTRQRGPRRCARRSAPARWEVTP